MEKQLSRKQSVKLVQIQRVCFKQINKCHLDFVAVFGNVAQWNLELFATNETVGGSSPLIPFSPKAER